MTQWASTLLIFAQTTPTARPVMEEPSLISPVMVFIVVLLILALPFGLGSMIARALKMKDLALKISVILLAAELGLAPFIAEYVKGVLEQRQYDQQLAHWKEKEEGRQKITAAGIDELKKANGKPRFVIQYKLPDKNSQTPSGE